jgi:ATP/maltotriose-dependent transcriptional regulator MalT
MAEAADTHIESEWLRRYGKQQHAVVTVQDDSTAKVEAVALAEVRVAEAERRMRDTTDSDELARLAGELVEAHKARATAQAMKVEAVRTVVKTGRTIADVWAGASLAERERMILRAGVFELTGGRKSPEERLAWLPHDKAPGLSLSTAFGLLVDRED